MLLSWQFVITALLLSLWLFQIVAVLYSVHGNSLACFELCWANPVVLITKRIRILNLNTNIIIYAGAVQEDANAE